MAQHNSEIVTCRTCGKPKPVDEFAVFRNTPGFLNQLDCFRCRNEKARTLRKQRPIQFKAYAEVGNARRKGLIKKQRCAVCKKLNKRKPRWVRVTAHHNDYLKPLDITWLCDPHHAAWHKIFIPENRQ